MINVLRDIIGISEEVKNLIRNPEKITSEELDNFMGGISELLPETVMDLNHLVEDQGDDFDYRAPR